MTIDEAAAILDVTRGTVLKLLAERRLKGRKQWVKGHKVWVSVDAGDVRRRRTHLSKPQPRKPFNSLFHGSQP